MPGDCVPGALVREGKALLYIPDPSKAVAPHGIEPAWLEVFYNPRMEYNRDVSVVALNAYTKLLAPVKDYYIAEPLTATGVRAVRYALEAEGVGGIIAGDISECAVSIAVRNTVLNGVEGKVKVYHRDARELLHATRHLLDRPPLVVDIDPFGSPAPYLNAALSVIGNKGLIAVTATDLAVLEGSKQRAALRKYGVAVRKTPESKEIGLRVLVGYAARVAAAHDKAVEPILAYYADHYFRAYLLVRRGARRADRMLESNIGYAYYCPGEKRTYIVRDPPSCSNYEQPVPVGPLWTGPLNDPGFISEMLSEAESRIYMSTRDRILGLLERLRCEASLEDRRLHLKLEQVASYARMSMPRVEQAISLLQGAGFRACRSHYSPTSIRTDASYNDVVRVLRAS